MSRFIFSKQRRAVWSRRIKGFWEEFRHNKIGLFGLVVVVLYAVIAILSPWLTPYDPLESRDLAGGFAKPQWITIFPQYSHLPPTIKESLSWDTTETSGPINVIESGEDLLLQYNGTETGSVTFQSPPIIYRYEAPQKFHVRFNWWAENVTNAEYSFDLYMTNPAGTKYLIWTSYQTNPSVRFSSLNRSITYVVFNSESLEDFICEMAGIAKGTNLVTKMFLSWPASAGEYKFFLEMKLRHKSESGTATIHFKETKLILFGQIHGLLGCDSLGRDVFSQLVFGSRISLAVGLFSAVLATSIGILIGIISGFMGGMVDEGIMRVVDILLCLPVLPLLLSLMVIFGANVWYLVILIAVFGWQGLSRIIRSQVLSLKEMPFVECAKAAGAGRFYIMLKHMLPNVLPVALASMVLSVPGAIMTEAAISFIGLGDPSAPTWGRMLHYANSMGGFFHLAWWWILPPGIAICLLTLAFVFIGHAVDEVVNPRLRRRR